MTSGQGGCFGFRVFSDDWDELSEYEMIVPNEFTLGDGGFNTVGIVGLDELL
jgi:hypothetical protein